MIDERFLHPLWILSYDRRTRPQMAFRKRNHLVPCTTRRMKVLRKKGPQWVAVDLGGLPQRDWE